MLSVVLALALAAASPVQQETPASLAAGPAGLHGALLRPIGETKAAALILPGSGPTDRNGDSLNNGTPLVVRAATYRLLAEGLADQGIATLRIDKRGIGESVFDGAEADLTFQTYIDDARAWAREAARLTGQPCVWLIGHSEGALVALGATRTPEDSICGLVLLSGAGRPAAEVIAQQLATLPEPLHGQAMTALADLAAGRRTDPVPGLEVLFRPSVQPYMISWFALDPARLAADYDGPIMIVQGETDLQTTVADAERLAQAQPRATLLRLPGVNHVLKVAPADVAANMATYSDPDLPLAPGVAEAVGGFILEPR